MATSIPASVTASPVAPAQQGQWQLAWRRFRAHRLAVASVAILLTLAMLAAAAPFISHHDPERPLLNDIFLSPSFAHPMGTDSLGRDLATRILYGGRISLTVGVLAMTVAMTLGILIGGVAGFYGGAVDGLLMRFVDMMLSFPRLFLLILFSVAFHGALIMVVVVLGGLSWMTVARLVRGAFLSLKQREYVEAARSVGARNQSLIWRHILPNALAPVIVAATLGVASAIIAESTLSFLGLGIQPPTPSWGNMLKDAPSEMAIAPWTAVFPGLAIFLAVVSINFIGDGLRDALDPRHVTQRGPK
jgi:peptide/nickel transport system permease protein